MWLLGYAIGEEIIPLNEAALCRSGSPIELRILTSQRDRHLFAPPMIKWLPWLEDAAGGQHFATDTGRTIIVDEHPEIA